MTDEELKRFAELVSISVSRLASTVIIPSDFHAFATALIDVLQSTSKAEESSYSSRV